MVPVDKASHPPVRQEMPDVYLHRDCADLSSFHAMWMREPGRSEQTQSAALLHFRQDRQIYGEGDPAELFFEVVSGVVRTCTFLGSGRRQIDGFHTAGDVFGVEAASAYSFSAEAVCNCTAISYRRYRLNASSIEDAALSRQLLSCAMRTLLRTQRHALLLGYRSAIEKVAAFLIDWGTHSADKTRIVLAMTRQDIADYLGLTIETVSRTLSQLERNGIIAMKSGRHIRIGDMNALIEINAKRFGHDGSYVVMRPT